MSRRIKKQAGWGDGMSMPFVVGIVVAILLLFVLSVAELGEQQVVYTADQYSVQDFKKDTDDPATFQYHSF